MSKTSDPKFVTRRRRTVPVEVVQAVPALTVRVKCRAISIQAEGLDASELIRALNALLGQRS